MLDLRTPVSRFSSKSCHFVVFTTCLQEVRGVVHLGTPGAEVSGAVLVCLAVIYVQKNGEKNLQPMGKSIVTTAIRGLPFSRSCTTSLTGLPILGRS